MPAELVTGGTTGMALTVNYLTGLGVSHFVLIFNVAMLVLGWIILGKAFAMTTLASTFLYPASLEICDIIFGDLVLTSDMLLCTVFTGLGIGMSLGIVIRAGASTGGMDIPPLVLQKLLRIPVSVSMYTFDFCILLTQIIFRPAENVLYGILLVLIYTIVLDKMLLLGGSRTELKIVSEKSDEICSAILRQLDRGVTLLDGEGGYLRQNVFIDLFSAKQCGKETYHIRLVTMRKNRICKIFFPGQGGGENSAVSLAALDQACFPNGTLLQESVEKDMYRAVLPGFLFRMFQQVGPGHGNLRFPKNIHNLHLTSSQFHLYTSVFC
jgi:uncharacterized membrane-anchored protein YitT (DUF2179 family)